MFETFLILYAVEVQVNFGHIKIQIHLPSGGQITLNDDDNEDKEDTTPLVHRQSKRGHLRTM